MKAAIHVNNSAHQREHVTWMVEGLERHGVESIVTGYNQPKTGDFAIIWGWRQNSVKEHCIREKMPLLVMERGHLQDRMKFTSLGWDGLAGRGRYPAEEDGGARWRRHWNGRMRPWRAGGDYALVCGQVEGDASLYGMNFNEWAQQMTDMLRARGSRVIYRPHPLTVKRGGHWQPRGAELSRRSLDEDLDGAKFAVTYNSTVAVETVLAGVPTITRDQGSVAWDVTSHSLDEPLWTGDREPWAHRLAWCQWSEQEIRSGEAWAAAREVMYA